MHPNPKVHEVVWVINKAYEGLETRAVQVRAFIGFRSKRGRV